MTRKVQLVRFWLLAIAAVLFAWLYRDPTLAIVPIAFFTGQAGCFCCPTSDCPTLCAAGPDAVTVVVAGFANGTCASCADYNGTYIISEHGPSIPCFGQTPDGFINNHLPWSLIPPTCGVSASAAAILGWLYRASGGNTELEIIVTYPCAAPAGNLEIHRWRKDLGTSPATCTGLSAADVPFFSRVTNCTIATFFCDTTSATMTVTSTP